MIAKVSVGANFTGLSRYLHGPGRENEHAYGLEEGGCVIGGNLLREGDRDGHRWALDMRDAAATRPDIERPVWHMSLRAAPTDPRLDDDVQWRDIGQRFATAMGWADKPWVMVRHGEDHVHIVASRVGYDGQVWDRGQDWIKARKTCVSVEREYCLTRTHERTPEQDVNRQEHRIKQGEFAKAVRTHEAPARTAIAERVRQARDHVARVGGSREDFETALAQVGVDYRLNVASMGRVSGYSFALAEGGRDAVGEQVWFPASKVDRSLAWAKLSKSFDQPAPQLPAPEVAPKRLLESWSGFERRVHEAVTAQWNTYDLDSRRRMTKGAQQFDQAALKHWGNRDAQRQVQFQKWAAGVEDRTNRRAYVEQVQRIREATNSGRPSLAEQLKQVRNSRPSLRGATWTGCAGPAQSGGNGIYKSGPWPLPTAVQSAQILTHPPRAYLIGKSFSSRGSHKSINSGRCHA